MDATNTSGNSPGHTPSPRAHVEEIAHSATRIVEESRSLATDVYQALDLEGRMERHPYQTLLIAAGIGYVLGGGLFTRLTGGLLRIGVRVAALPLVTKELETIAETAMGTRQVRTG